MTRSPRTPRLATLLAATLLMACRGESSRDATNLEQLELDSLVTSLMPAVAEATGLQFKSTPRAAIRTRDEVRTYLLAKLARLRRAGGRVRRACRRRVAPARRRQRRAGARGCIAA
jgi:hypothetical protein